MCQVDIQDENLLTISCKAFGVCFGVQSKLPRSARMVDRNEEWQKKDEVGLRRRIVETATSSLTLGTEKPDTSKVIVRNVAIRGAGIR